MTAVYKRELRSFFQSMTGYVITAFMVVFAGIYFMAYNLNMGVPYFSFVLLNINYILIIVVPLLTMRSFAEERKNKTDQLLLTSPVRLSEIVLGKYLAMVTVYAVPCLIFCLFPLIIKGVGVGYPKVDYMSIFLFFMMGCVYIAIGMFLSSLTESQVIAAVTTFGALLLVFLWGGLIEFLPTTKESGIIGMLLIISVAAFIVYRMTKNYFLAGILELAGIVGIMILGFAKGEVFENLLVDMMNKFYIAEVFENVAVNRLFDLSGLIMYLTVIGVFVFLTVQSIQKRRWS